MISSICVSRAVQPFERVVVSYHCSRIHPEIPVVCSGFDVSLAGVSMILIEGLLWRFGLLCLTTLELMVMA